MTVVCMCKRKDLAKGTPERISCQVKCGGLLPRFPLIFTYGLFACFIAC